MAYPHKFHMQHGQTLGLQNHKIQGSQESKMAANAKNKPIKSTFSPEWHDLFC